MRNSNAGLLRYSGQLGNSEMSSWYRKMAIGVIKTIVAIAVICIIPISAKAASENGNVSNAVHQRSKLTVLFDAFGRDHALVKDWGYSAFIEIAGKRILFDTGNDPAVLEHNARAKGIDLSRLDFVIISHRHGDHIGGLSYVLSINPNVKIYAPKEPFGVFGSSLPASFYRKDTSLAPEKRYFDGSPPDVMKFGKAWPNANIELIDSSAEIAPGISLISLVSDKPGTLELRELSLAIDTPQGLVLVVGCSHPGIDRIVDAASSINNRIHLILGGMHLALAPDAEIAKLVSVLRDQYHVDWIAPGHCTGEPAFAALEKSFGAHYLYAGLGSVIDLDMPRRASNDRPQRRAMDLEDLHDYRKIKRDMFVGFGKHRWAAER